MAVEPGRAREADRHALGVPLARVPRAREGGKGVEGFAAAGANLYFPRPSGDELEAQWMEWHGLEPPSGGYDRPPEVANADVGGMGDWELAGVGGVGEWELAGA